MATVISTDQLYLNYPFKVEIIAGNNNTIFSGGFNSVNIPEITFESTEYRVGDGPLYRNRPLGLPTFNEVSLQRGKLVGDVEQIQKLIAANLKYRNHRYTVKIYHYHHGPINNNDRKGEVTVITLHKAIVTRVKPDGDLDSMSSDVSIQEIDFTYEYYTIEKLENDIDNQLWKDFVSNS